MNQIYLSDSQIAKRYNVHRSTIWRWLNDRAGFPAPVKLGPQITRWKLSEIEAWEASRA